MAGSVFDREGYPVSLTEMCHDRDGVVTQVDQLLWLEWLDSR